MRASDRDGLEGGEVPLGLAALAGDLVEGFDFGFGEEEAAGGGGGFGEVGLLCWSLRNPRPRSF
jgi:hypothetical protein